MARSDPVVPVPPSPPGPWATRADRAAGMPRPAWYPVAPGPWRDWLTVLHLPYTGWHLAYVLIGAGLAPRVDDVRLVATLLAFALAVGVAAHALDELNGRPLGTAIPSPTLAAVGGVAVAGAVALGAVGIGQVGWGLSGFIAVGVALVVGYNLELCGGILHSDAVFAAAWGAFPLLTSYYAQTGTVAPAAAVAAVFAFGLSRAQRVLSTEARHLRRRVVLVEGTRHGVDGSRDAITAGSLLRPLERALAALSWSTVALGVALVLSRWGR